MINIPNKEQWEMMNEHLYNIAEALGSQIDVSTWSGVQKAVRTGIAPELFPIGSSFVVEHTTYGQLQFDVVAHDHFKGAYDDGAHTMTLMCHSIVNRLQFDEAEAFYYTSTELAAGTYNFTVPTYMQWSGTYQFTLTKNVPSGSQFCISSAPNKAMETLSVLVYNGDTIVEECAIAVGSGGISLGTFGTELNSVHRVAYGSDNYKESALRQYVNSAAVKGAVWTRQTKFDRPPTWANTTAGFLNGIDEEFLSVVGVVKVPCVTNATYESPDSTTVAGELYTVKDKFYLASVKEIFGIADGVIDNESKIFPYYEGVTDIDRIKYERSGNTYLWWLRSPSPILDHSMNAVTREGVRNAYATATALGVVPVCTIV